MFRPFRSISTAAVVLALALAACGGGAPTAAPGGTSSTATQAPGATVAGTAGASALPTTGKAACDVLTSADIEEITGAKVAKMDPEPVDTTYQNVCRWTFEGPGQMDLGILSPGGASHLERSFEFEGGDEITGLGDRAVRLETSGSLMALSGDTVVDLFVLSAGFSDEVEEQIVERAIENLGE